ncbi:hypothetical protein FE633_20485 [Streptomyces montanus]|uniref:Ku domain-containing protein n=1 Tax=Streptomyces montanus TaxID=2580423 RepID=A0A5R9FKK9_9ACTN|nr:hypothetical protein FE633_20485 [Streptomyces montanus]
MDAPTQAVRTVWIMFGLVSLPVQLFPATRRHGVDLHEVHATDGSRTRHRRVCQAEHREVENREIAKGHETPDRPTVVLREEDLEALPLTAQQAHHRRPRHSPPRRPGPAPFLPCLLRHPARASRAAAVRAAGGRAGPSRARSRGQGDAAHQRAPVRAVDEPRHAGRPDTPVPRRNPRPGNLGSTTPVTGQEPEPASPFMTQPPGIGVAAPHHDYAAAPQRSNW